MKKTIILLLTCTLLHAQDNADELLAQKLFAKAFKNSSNENKIYIPLTVNNILQDEVLVKIDSAENIFITKETMEYIASLLKDEYGKQFQYRVDENSFAPLSALHQFGIMSKYDSENITLNVSIPPKLKKTSLINFNRNRNRNANGLIVPKSYSGGVNLYFNQRYKNDSNSNDLEREPLTASSDIFLNIKDVVLEGRVNYDERTGQFIRDRFKIIKDDEDNQLRYTIGDIFLPNSYRMSYSEVLGLSVEKKFQLNRDYSQNGLRVNSYEFFLKNSSRVEIFINDRFDRALNLDEGTHNLYDLGIPSGLNQIKLKIIEDNGKIEFLEFDDFNYGEILEKGTLKYGIGMGISSAKDNNKFIYNKEEKLISAYINYGLFDATTIKSGIQTADDFKAISFEFLIGTNFGMFDPYIIYSETDELKGIKNGVDYRTNIGNLNINLGYEETEESYRRLDNYNHNNFLGQKLYRANIYTPLGAGINLNLSASQYIKEDEEEKTVGVKVSKRLFNQVDLQLNLDTTQKENQKREDTIYFTLSYQLGKNRINYSNYTNENRYQISASRSSSSRYGISSNMNYNHSDESEQYYARVAIKDEKFKLDTSYNMMDKANGNQKNQSLGFQLATGIVFAGERATFTAPINSSFVIVNNDDKLEQPLGLEGYQNSDDYIYDSFAIGLGDYSQRELSVDETELDFGIDLENPSQIFLTNYKSGSVMEIAVQNLMSIKGLIVDDKGEPVKNKAFKVFNTQTGSKVIGFTDSYGKFSVPEIEIGKYNATFVKEEGYEGVSKFKFEIKDDSQNLIDLGTIKIKMPKKKEKKKYLIFDGKDKS